jgi:type II secretory pathway pseudopilin PulG
MHPERCPTPRVVSDTVQQPALAADTRSVGIRLRDESGMGLIELLIAMVVLNVGLFAVVGVFNGATVAIARAATISSATAVADRQMEIYRSLQNCSIWLDTTNSTAGQTFPAINSGSLYQADTKSYTNPYTGTAVEFLDKSLSGQIQNGKPWSTTSTSSILPGQLGAGDIPTFCPQVGTTPPTTATEAVQDVAGPDGKTYTVDTYIILVQPPGGRWVKQVTIVVRDQQTPTKILARETSIFNPMSG